MTLDSWPQSNPGYSPYWKSPPPSIQWWTVRPLSMQHPLHSNFHRLQTYSFLSPPSSKTSPVPVERLVLCCPQHCPVFITPLTGYPGPPRTCAAPRSLQECAGACNRLCGGHWVVWLTETSQPHSALAAEWGSAWGDSPNHGRCQIPTVALHNHSHTGPDIPPGRRGREGKGGRDVVAVCVCVGQRAEKVYI